jgi:hypothetical protein
MYFTVIRRSWVLQIQSEQPYFAAAVNFVFAICLFMIGTFSAMPKSLRYDLLSNSWFRKYKDVLIQILAPGLGLWAWLVGLLISAYILYWTF